MPKPTEHKTVQARILEYVEAEGRDIGNWRLDIGDSRLEIGDLRLECGVSFGEFYTGETSNWHGRRQIRERREDLDSGSLSNLRSLRFFISGFRGLNRRERRDRKEDLDRPICNRLSPNLRKFSRRLRENRLLVSEHFCDSLSQNFHIV